MRKEQYLREYANEDQFTIATNRYINANYPALRHLYFHVPNESATNAIIRMRLYNMGVLAGVPDFIFLKPYLWCMELKMPGGYLSPKQKELHNLWQHHGIQIELCKTADQVVAVLDKHFK